MKGITGASNGRGLEPRLRRRKEGGMECWRHAGAAVERCPFCYQHECVKCRDLDCRCCGLPFKRTRARRYMNPDRLRVTQAPWRTS